MTVPGDSREVTANEVLSRLNDARQEIRDDFAQLREDFAGLRSDIRGLDYIPRKEFEAKHDNLERRVSGNEQAIKWAAGIIIGAVIMAVLGLVLVQGGTP